ncbi:MAG: hypothetical protein ICV62_15155 [Cyanobacteria bacterium Co-bin13]|nr:hypothetical protein [Cyanobacteria bacterium Co-bin13]
MQIKIQLLPNGWYACQVRHSSQGGLSTDSWHASPLEAYLHVMGYDQPGTYIELPPGEKIDRLREQAIVKYLP